MKVFEGIISDIKEAFQKEMMSCIGTVYLDQKNEFEKAIASALEKGNNEEWKNKVDSYLQNISWDKTWDDMLCLIKQQIADS